MRKLVLTVALAATALSTPALASNGARSMGAEGGVKFVQGNPSVQRGLEISKFLPDIENKGDGRRTLSQGDSLVESLAQGDLDVSDFLPDVENQGGNHPPKPQEPDSQG